MTNSAEDKRPRLLRRIASLLWVMLIAIVIGFFYFASSLCVTFLLAAFRDRAASGVRQSANTEAHRFAREYRAGCRNRRDPVLELDLGSGPSFVGRPTDGVCEVGC